MKFVFSCAVAVWTALGAYSAHAQEIDGVLETGPVYSALFTTSPESGDPIGLAFRNRSPAGQTILTNCLHGMYCKVGRATTRPMHDTSALKFVDQPSGWLEVTQARDVAMETVVFGYEKSVKTRFGVLSVDDTNRIALKGKLFQPVIENDDGISIVAHYEMGASDVVLLQKNGGRACPARFQFITVHAKGVQPTKEFGSCSDIIYPQTDLASFITVSMPGFAGPFESEAVQNKAMRTKLVFRYERGVLSLNGKAVQ